MKEVHLKSDRVLQVTSPSYCCEACAMEMGHLEWYPFEIAVTNVEATEDSWIAKGKGEIELEKKCPRPNCNRIYQAILHTIPIQCESIPCPKCGTNQDLQYRLKSIFTKERYFEFEAHIVCKSCSKKRSLKKIIKNFLEIVKIEIKPTGMTIKSG